jgi:hypothetical protein
MTSGSFIDSLFRRLGLFVPDAEEAAKNNELTEMISGVVSDEKRFAKKILAVAPAEGFEEVGVGFGDESFEELEVFADRGDRCIPGVCGGWLGGLGPVLFGPLERMVAAGGRRGELEDVPLGDAEMLEELPGGIGEIWWDGGAMLGRKIFDGVVEGGVGLASVEEIEDLFAEFGLFGVRVLGRIGLFRFAHAVPSAYWMQAEGCRIK